MGYKIDNVKELAKGSGILVFSNVVLKAIQFFLLPLYTNYLTPGELGISDTITSFTAFLYPLLVMAFDSAFSAFFYEQEEKGYSDKVFNTVFFFLVMQSVIPIILAFGGRGISDLMFGDSQYSMGIVFALWGVTVNLWYLPFSLSVRMENRMKTFAVINVVGSLLMILLNIWFVSVLRWGYMSLLASTLIAHLVQFGLYVYSYRGKPIGKGYVDKTLFRQMFKYAIPYIPMTVSTWILNMSDRYMLLFIAGENSVGIYGIGGRFVTVLSVVISGISTAYTSFAFKSHKDTQAKEMFADVVRVLFIFLAGICTTISLFGKDIIYLMTSPEYYQSYTLLPALMFSQLAYALYTFTGYGIAFKKKSQYFFYSVTAGAVVNVILNFLLIPLLNADGAALTTLLGTLVMLSISYPLAQKLYPCGFGIVKIGLVFGVLFITSFLFMNSSFIVKIIVWLFDAIITITIYRATIKRMFVAFTGR